MEPEEAARPPHNGIAVFLLPAKVDQTGHCAALKLWIGRQDTRVIDWQQQILIVSPFFYPELISTGKANQHLAEAFVAEGHGVSVVCSHPLYPAWEPVRSSARIPGMTIVRGGAGIRYPMAMPLRRLKLEAWFAVFATRSVWRRRKKADVVVSILPPSLFILFVNRILPRHVRRVAVVHDLQGVLAAQENGFLRRAIVRMIHAVESRAFRSQDLCIFFSEDMARIAQQSYGLHPSQIAVQYPSITLPASHHAKRATTSAHHLDAQFPPDKVHVVYSGALGYKQNSQELVALMHAAAMRHPEVQFHVLSGGPFYESLRAEYEQRKGSRVQFHPLVPEQDLAELYARSAIHIIPQAEGTESAALPSKLPNLLAAGVHLLAICSSGSEVERMIQLAGTGTIATEWDEELFLTRLQEALEIVQRESASARRARVEPILDRFSITNMVRLVTGEQAAPEDPRPKKHEPVRETTAARSEAR
ncbi:MAG TPA: glycosyltransferase [Acidobacteriaceae bacterium]|nr:glycosyltransferase [Acidobacteriaceae bacterium]